MHIPRLYEGVALSVSATVVLSPEAHHHVHTVLRLGVGMPVVLFNGDGQEYTGQIQQQDKRQTEVYLTSVSTPERESPIAIHLGQGICRGDKMDWVIQKTVELGVSAITPLWTDYGQVKRDQARLASKYLHWQRIMVSAVEQSGRTRLPILHPPMLFAEWVLQQRVAHRYLLHPMEGACQSEPRVVPGETVSLAVGPEAGFSPTEVECATTHQFVTYTLGPRILRAETAAVVAVAWAQWRFGGP